MRPPPRKQLDHGIYETERSFDFRTADRDVPRDYFKRLFEAKGSTTRWELWKIGDLLHEAEKRYGETYDVAMEATGLSEKRLRNLRWLAGTFQGSRRRDISLGHHEAVTALPVKEQDWLLELAESERWTRERMREEVAALRPQDLTPDPQPIAAGIRPEDASPWVQATVQAQHASRARPASVSHLEQAPDPAEITAATVLPTDQNPTGPPTAAKIPEELKTETPEVRQLRAMLPLIMHMQQQFPEACTGELAERVQGVREEIERRLAEAETPRPARKRPPLPTLKPPLPGETEH